MASKVLYQIISISIGIICITSAILKLFPIQFFELTLVENHLSSWYLTPIVSRIIIGSEIALGIVLMLNSLIHKHVIKIAIGIFSIYSVFLIVTLIIKGNSENCMCFGTHFQLTPIESLIKNIIILFLLLYLHKQYIQNQNSHYKIITVSIVIISISAPFIKIPVIPHTSSLYIEDNDNPLPDLRLQQLLNNITDSTFRKTVQHKKFIILFSSLTCNYCKIAAYKFSIIKQQNPSIPIYMFLLGNKKNEVDFFNISKSSNIPHSYLSMNEFLSRSGIRLPAIYLIEDGRIIKKIRYTQIIPEDITTWLYK